MSFQLKWNDHTLSYIHYTWKILCHNYWDDKNLTEWLRHNWSQRCIQDMGEGSTGCAK